MPATRFSTIFAAAAALALAGCASLVSNATAGFGRNLSTGILEQDDPELVADGLPAYLLLLDGLIAGDPGSGELLLSGARLYGAYASGFVADEARRKALASKAHDYARRGTCALDAALCAALDADFETYTVAVAAIERDDLHHAYPLAAAWAGLIQADSGSLDRVAELPKVEALFERIVALDRTHDHGTALVYLGVMASLRPESLGGRPAAARVAFEDAIAASGGRNLMARVYYAEYYARLVFDQALHDRLLAEALAAPAKAPGLTLSNVLAQQRARALVESGKDYF